MLPAPVIVAALWHVFMALTSKHSVRRNGSFIYKWLLQANRKRHAAQMAFMCVWVIVCGCVCVLDVTRCLHQGPVGLVVIEMS